MPSRRLTTLALTLATTLAVAGPDDFTTGPVITAYGPAASIDDVEFPAHTRFRVAFDVAEAAGGDRVSRGLESVARFLNMHVRAGIPREQIALAVVVHGPAALDLVQAERYGGPNASAALVAELISAGVSIELCGQTAAYRDITRSDLLPGVTMALSAMTAHALLQQRGYTLNPF